MSVRGRLMTVINPPRRTVLVRRPNYANRGHAEFKRNLTYLVETWLVAHGPDVLGPDWRRWRPDPAPYDPARRRPGLLYEVEIVKDRNP